MTCPLCNGAKMRVVVAVHQPTGKKILKTNPCPCYVSELVSDTCELLKSWRNEWVPLNKIDVRLQFDPQELPKVPNYIIRGNYGSFCLSIKSLMMAHRFDEVSVPILFCRSIDILHDYYVQQKDGTSPQISDTDMFSLIAICMDTEEKNTMLKTVIAQVIQTRLRDRKPTWLYLPDNRQSLSACTQEYSPELEVYTAGYQKIELIGRQNAGPVSVNRDDAANFGRAQ